MLIICNIIFPVVINKCCFNSIHPNYNQFGDLKALIGHYNGYNTFLIFQFEFHHFKNIRFISIKEQPTTIIIS